MGRVVHFEIHADEPDRAASYYRELFGWRIEKWNGPMEYWMVFTGADGTPGINGGLMKRPHPLSGNDGVIAYVCTVACVFVTAFYTFRMMFMAFHGKPRYDAHHPPHESPLVVTVPLILLAVPSVVAGYLVGDFVFGNYFGDSLPAPDPNYFGIGDFLKHGLTGLPFYLALAGIALSWYFYMKNPAMPARVASTIASGSAFSFRFSLALFEN